MKGKKPKTRRTENYDDEEGAREDMQGNCATKTRKYERLKMTEKRGQRQLKNEKKPRHSMQRKRKDGGTDK